MHPQAEQESILEGDLEDGSGSFKKLSSFSLCFDLRATTKKVVNFLEETPEKILVTPMSVKTSFSCWAIANVMYL